MQNKIKLIENKNAIVRIDNDYYTAEEAIDMIMKWNHQLDLIINKKNCISQMQNSKENKF